MPRPRHAFVVRDRATIPPLGVPAAETWLLGGTLWEHSLRVLERAGLTVERVESVDEANAKAAATPDGAVVTHDSVGFSRSVVHHLLARAARDERPAIAAALPVARATQVLAHIGGLATTEIDGTPAFTAPLAVVRTPGDATPVLLPYKEADVKLPTPVGMIGHTHEPFGATDTYLCKVDHWAHVLRLNQAALVAHWFERWQRGAGKLWFLWRLLAGFPWRRGRLTGAIRSIHRKAKVHHTAHVELSVVEAGAEIGANAVVKGSWIGKGARIDDGAIVNATVLGAGASVASASSVMAAVLFPRAFAAQHKMQFSVLGEASVAFTGSYFYDLNFAGNVRVAHRGAVVDAGSRFLSVCLGPWARVAGGVWIASGREVPARALIVQPPDHVLHRIDDELAQRALTTIEARALTGIGELPSNMPDEPPGSTAIEKR